MSAGDRPAIGRWSPIAVRIRFRPGDRAPLGIVSAVAAIGVVAILLVSGSIPPLSSSLRTDGAPSAHLVLPPLAPVRASLPTTAPPIGAVTTNPLNYTWAGSVTPNE